MLRYVDEDWARLAGAVLAALVVALLAAFLVPGAQAAERTRFDVSSGPTRELHQDVSAAF